MIAHAEKRKLKDGSIRWYAIYLAPSGRRTSEGGFSTKRKAEQVAHRRTQEVESGGYLDPARARLTFATYVERFYWPAIQHREPTTLAAYRSNLDKHFLPTFGAMPMKNIRPSVVQAWVNDATKSGLSARSVGKYHTLLSSIFRQAVVDQAVAKNPCEYTKLPKVVRQPKTAISPEQFDVLMDNIAPHFQLLVSVAIESGLRWGELAALRPIDIDFASNTIIVRRVVLEVSKKITGAEKRYLFRDYPKDNEQREVVISRGLCRQIKEHMVSNGYRKEDLLFSTSTGGPISRNTFRTRAWRPAVEASGIRQNVRFHDLRGAHASWLLAGGADLKVVMDRLGHRQINTTQQYLGTLPDAGERALAAFESVRSRHH